MLVAINALLIAKTRDFLGPYLVGAKPAIRALLKAANLCTKEPEAGVRVLVNRGFEPRYDVIVKVLEEVHYLSWRDTHPKGALHFLGLRLHEAGLPRLSYLNV